MSEASWYEVVDEERLRQGDIVIDCPVVMVAIGLPHDARVFEKEKAIET
jgi:hypothetical protein